MLFNSVDFALFLPIVFLLYWFVVNGRLSLQNGLLLIASYFFYACWDTRFMFLLLFSTLLDFYTGLRIARSDSLRARKIWFWLSIGVNLGFLGVFKYYNFFQESLAEALALIGVQTNFVTLSVILPVGISFYTFHGLSYVIDVYKGRIEPERNFVDYAVFVSFFPLLVAGPIERATHLLPQIKRARFFNYSLAVDGMRQILWGLFKKMVIADNCAVFVNTIFSGHDEFAGSTLAVGAVLFAFQIYCDFSGYSDIALGTARLFGIELLRNFAFPYFSRDIAEFWRRWHISLSTWFRDYLYIPLGGSKGSTWGRVRNTMIIFLVSGFWHGANWTFIMWGALNALYFLPLLISGKNRENLNVVAVDSIFPTFRELTSIAFTFGLTVFAWIFFRAESVGHAFDYIGRLFSETLFSIPEIKPAKVILAIVFLLVMEWIARDRQHALQNFASRWYRPFRWSFYYALILAILLMGGEEQAFIYFQF